MHVLFNMVGFYADKAKAVAAAIVEDSSGVYVATMVGSGWSGSIDLPDSFRSQRDVRSTATALNARFDGAFVAKASVQGKYRQAWCEERGEWSLEDLVNEGKITAATYNALCVYYGLEAEAAA